MNTTNPDTPQQEQAITLTKSQANALDRFKQFISDPSAKVFILKGYAGTGKTTLVRLFTKELEANGCLFSLLASTGRAAKILCNITEEPTHTVHSEIYKFTKLSQDLEQLAKQQEQLAKQQEQPHADETGQLYLNFELMPKTKDENPLEHYYIVDEASMVSDARDPVAAQAVFGSGKLLHDLLLYDDMGKFIFVGDICQLPPVTQNFSPALDARYLLSQYRIKAYECELTQVMRQSGDNDIVLSAQQMRRLYHNPPMQQKWAKFPLKGYSNIHILHSQTELISRYVECVREGGFNSSTMLCLENKQAAQTTQLLRPIFGHRTCMLEKGDLLLITQNNYITGLMNGDLVVVEEVGAQILRAGLTFINVKVKELFTGRTVSHLMISEVLYSNATNISQANHRSLYIDFYYRMKANDVDQGSEEFYQAMMVDPYLNALRAVFGYVLTCHKSQGGEWDNVFIDIPRKFSAMPKPYVYQWLYTAMTRARKELYVVYDFWVV